MQLVHDPLTVLVVDDQSSVRAAIAGQLDSLGHRVLEAGDADWALDQFHRHRPDVVLLDVVMPGEDGYAVARRLRQAEAGGWTPIIFLSVHGEEQNIWRGIQSGGDDYLAKPVSDVVLEAKLRAMQRLKAIQRRLEAVSAELRLANEQLRHQTEHDELTGLLNRRGFDRLLHGEVLAGFREQQPLTLVLCDIDMFKPYNDELGHVEGDRCLGRIAQILREACLRPRDRAARYGGEEFALVLPNTPKSGAMTLARALRRMVNGVGIPHPRSTVASHVTLSGGITTCIPDAGTTAETMVIRADQALYAAKAQGRDRFFSFEMQLDTEEQRLL